MSDLLGRPIEGEVNRFTTPPPPQDEPQKFLDALDAILAVPGVEAVRWQQYTPSFNDGEACEFGVHEASVKIAGDRIDVEDDDTGEDYYESESGNGYRTEYDLYGYDYSTKEYRRKFVDLGEYDAEAIFNALDAFERVIQSGRHDTLLNDKFGDPADVIATRDGFTIEYYETPY